MIKIESEKCKKNVGEYRITNTVLGIEYIWISKGSLVQKKLPN